MVSYMLSELCAGCLNLRKGPRIVDLPTPRWGCLAFPDGIPEEILTSAFIHTEPYPGDHDIQFEPIEGA